MFRLARHSSVASDVGTADGAGVSVGSEPLQGAMGVEHVAAGKLEGCMISVGQRHVVLADGAGDRRGSRVDR